MLKEESIWAILILFFFWDLFSFDSFTAEDKASNESYTYVFQLCGDAGGVRNAGLIQVDKKTQKSTVIGKYTKTQAIGGSKTLQNLKNILLFVQTERACAWILTVFEIE